MGVNRLNVLLRILVTQLNHWTLYTFVFLYFIIHHARNEKASLQVGVWLLFGLVPLGLYAVRLYINKTWLFWIVHVCAVLLVAVLPIADLAYRLIYVGITFIYSILSVLCRYGKERLSKKYLPVPAFFGITVVMMLLLQYLELHDYQRYYLYLLVFQLCLGSITIYTDRYLQYVGAHKYSIGYMPVQSIFSSGIKLITACTMAVAAVLCAVAGVGKMNDILKFLEKNWRAFVKKMVELLRKWFLAVQQKEKTLTDNSSEGVTSVMDALQETGSTFLEDIVLRIIFIVVCFLVLRWLLKVLPRFLDRLKLPQYIEEEEPSFDVKERSRSIPIERRKVFSILAGMTAAEKIRKRYKRKLESEKARIVAKGKVDQMELYTAREATNILEQPMMGKLYEKARYSPYECTSEDAKRMKQLCKSKN